MNVLSLYAGIGGFDLAFHQVGARVVAHVEIDPHARAVLSRHNPGALSFADVRSVGRHNLPDCDVICGGFPCQDLSVAGNRAGLAGARSGLFYEMVRITDELRPAFLLWENVPGLLSSDNGRDFARVLRALDDIGYSGAWTGLDAQFFGLAQRRQRIFGLWARNDIGAEPCAKILALAARLPWNTQARPEARTDVAATIRGGSSGHGVDKPGRRGDDDVNIVSVAATLTGQMQGMSNQWAPHNEADNLIPVSIAENQRGELRTADIAPQLTTGGSKPGQGYSAVLAPAIAQSNRGRATGELAETLRADSHGALPMVFGGNDTSGERSVAAALTGGGRYDFESENFVVAGALSASHGGADDTDAQARHLVLAFTERGRTEGRTLESQEDIAYALTSPGDGGRTQSRQIAGAFGVRRLTPLECERLQGFPDNYTAGQSDSTRYRQLGNAVAVPVARWIAGRLMAWFRPAREAEAATKHKKNFADQPYMLECLEALEKRGERK